MKRSLRMIAVWSVLFALVSVGFVAAAKVDEFAILPMPSEGMVEKTPVEAKQPEQVTDEKQTAPAADEAQADAAAEQGQVGQPAAEDHAEQAEERVVVAFADVEWTEEELRALRELAQERLAAKELMSQLSEYFKGFWDEEVSGWFDGSFSERTGMAVEEAGELAREWLDAQRELAREFAEEVKELREELRTGERQD